MKRHDDRPYRLASAADITEGDRVHLIAAGYPHVYRYVNRVERPDDYSVRLWFAEHVYPVDCHPTDLVRVQLKAVAS